ncbi:MAG: FAD-dependent thymidylate synthase [Anaerolineae bacterium]|nr:FAD-dependent thymidylate synthase [Anaerolineae bacterium]
MTPKRDVYLLDPMDLPPETIAVAFAKTSRSPQSFRQIAAELTEERSAEFHEKWVVGYGHASVAEHAVLHIAVENISRLAVECLESNRLASYTEKSTRYQKWGAEDFHTPTELDGHPLLGLYRETVQMLFETYQQSLEPVRQVVAARTPRKEGESDAALERRIRSDYVDVCRFLLPAAALANVGMTINARALEHALRKMLSHPLAEVRQMGDEIRHVAEMRVPTLIKYVQAVPYWEQVAHDFGVAAAELPGVDRAEDWCHLEACDADGELRVLAAALYRAGAVSFGQALHRVRAMSPDQRTALAETLLGGRGRHDLPPRELEYARYTIDLTLDQGGYFELKRHRMMTQTVQPLSTRLGYALPRFIQEAGFEQPYRAAMQAAHLAFSQLETSLPAAAAYVVPNGYNRRVLMDLNLRSALHLISLRSAANAHFSMRRAAQRVAEEIRAVSPLLGGYIANDTGESWQSVERDHFAAATIYPD